MKLGLILLAGVFGVFYVYPFATATDQSASWFFYAAQGFFAAFLCAIVFAQNRHPAIRLAMAWGFLEQLQVGIAGLLTITTEREIPFVDAALLDRIGPWPYAAIGSLAILYLWRRYAPKE